VSIWHSDEAIDALVDAHLEPDGPECVECGRVAHLTDGREIYPHRQDLWHKSFWLCICGAYCGTHAGTETPLGYPAGPITRRARSEAHKAFDSLWRGRGAPMNRRAAYAWLAEAMRLPAGECHIGMMTAAQARRVVELSEQRWLLED
jgi:hypothetical protein